MLKGYDIICISSIDWDFIWQGHQEIMSSFAKAGNRVLFIENTGARSVTLKDLGRLKKRFLNWGKSAGRIKEAKNGLYVMSPLLLPFPYCGVFRYFNKLILLSGLKKWMKEMHFDKVVFWVYLPTALSLEIIKNIEHKLIVYNCIDNLSLSSKEAKKIEQPESLLIKMADLIFVSGRNLYEHCRKYRDYGIYLFREGVNIENFAEIYNKEISIPNDLANIPQPIIGYVGGVHKWLDQDLIKYAAQNNPGCSFVLVGPVQSDVFFLKGIKNIHFLGQKSREELPLYIKQFRVGIIPYVISGYTENVYPTKLNEYLALGKPVISTDLPEVSLFSKEYGNIVDVCRGNEEFALAIKRIVSKENNLQEIEMRKRVAKDNSWSTRIAKMSDKMEEVIRFKNQDKVNR